MMKQIGTTLSAVGCLGLSILLSFSGCTDGSDPADPDEGNGSKVADGGDPKDGGTKRVDGGEKPAPGKDASTAEDAGASSGRRDASGGTGGADASPADASSADASSDAGSSDAASPEPVVPQVLVPYAHIRTLSSPPSIAVDAQYVYWTSSWVGANPPTPLPEPSGTFVMRVPKTGGDVSVLYESTNGLGTNFITDATTLYVGIGVDIYQTQILKVAKDGSGVSVLAMPPGLDIKRQFAIAGPNLYFEHGTDIDSVPLAGGAIAEILDNINTPHPSGFADLPLVFGLTTDGTNLYYSGNTDGMLQLPLAGGTPLLLHTRNTDAARISHSASTPVVKDGFVYWHYYGYIYKAPVGGGAVTTVVEPVDSERAASDPFIAIDGGYIYWVNYGLKKAALDGSSRATVLEQSAGYSVSAFAIDDTSVYMFAWNGTGIIKVPK